VLDASATAALTASAKLAGEVPTSSIVLYVPGMGSLLLLSPLGSIVRRFEFNAPKR
jgi:hypothetical protein